MTTRTKITIIINAENNGPRRGEIKKKKCENKILYRIKIV